MDNAAEAASIFPPLSTMAVLLALNIALPLLAIRLGRKMPGVKPLFHALAVIFVVASPFLFLRLDLTPEDAALPGSLDGVDMPPPN